MDRPQGDDWWQASDGKWYPPESRTLPPPPGEFGETDEEQRKRARRRWRLFLLGGFLGVMVAVEIAESVFGSGAGQEVALLGSIPYGLFFWFGIWRILRLRDRARY